MRLEIYDLKLYKFVWIAWTLAAASPSGFPPVLRKCYFCTITVNVLTIAPKIADANLGKYSTSATKHICIPARHTSGGKTQINKIHYYFFRIQLLELGIGIFQLMERNEYLLEVEVEVCDGVIF